MSMQVPTWIGYAGPRTSATCQIASLRLSGSPRPGQSQHLSCCAIPCLCCMGCMTNWQRWRSVHPPAPVVSTNPFRPYRKQFNPRRKSRGQQSPDAHGVTKALTDQAWDLLWKVACQELMPESDSTAQQTLDGQPRKRALAVRPKLQARRRLALALLRATWDRRSSVAALTWGDLTRSRDGVWMVRQQRKGSEPAWYPVPPGLMTEVAHFRRAIGLQPMPQQEEMGRSLFWTGGAVGAKGSDLG
jgi:hypothetical protein